MSTEWQYTTIGDAFKTGAGGTPLKSKKEYYENGSIPWLLSGEVCQKNIEASEKCITEAGIQNSSAKLFPANTVLVAMYGATAGQVGILRFEASTNQAVCGILPNKNYVPEFVYYWMLSQKDNLVAQATGNAQPNISQIKVKNTPIPCLEITEQQRIVAILDEAFNGIAAATANAKQNLKNARELFENYRDTVYRVGGPSWLNNPLSELCSIKHGFAFKSEFFSDRGDYVLLTPGNYYEVGGYRDRGQKQKYYDGEIPPDYLLQKEDFLIAMTEQAVGLLGSSLIVPEDDTFLHNQRLGLVQPAEDFTWCNEFFFHQFNTRTFRDAVQHTASGVKVRHTSPKKLGAITVSYPESYAEQRAIAKKLDTMLDDVRKLEAIYQQKLAALSELKQSLLQKAFAGELH